MSTMKTYRFSVDARWSGDQQTQVTTPGKPELTVATPPQFRGGVEGLWTPEHLLVASVASCYTVTLAAIAARMRLPLQSLDVRAGGDVTRHVDGSFGFTVIELDVSLETDPGCETEAEAAAKAAEERCLISTSLDAPVHVELDVRCTPRPRDARLLAESHPRRGETDPLPDAETTASRSH